MKGIETALALLWVLCQLGSGTIHECGVSDDQITCEIGTFPEKTNQQTWILIGSQRPKEVARFFASGNELRTIPEVTYAFHSNEIDLTRNNISNLDGLEYLPSLVALNLSSNDLHFIPKGAFLEQRRLKSLDLSYNKLNNLDGVFNGLVNLTDLYLHSNEIQVLSKDAFGHLVKLENVDLSHNRFKAVGKEIFMSNEKLRELRIQGVEELKILEDEFLANSSIQKLIITENPELQFLPDQIFSSNQLGLVDVRGNDLRRLDVANWEALKSIDGVFLERNKWECTCEAAGIVDFVSLSSQILCHLPEHLKGTTLSDLDPSNLTCYSPHAEHRHIRKFAPADNPVHLNCSIHGLPYPAFEWTLVKEDVVVNNSCWLDDSVVCLYENGTLSLPTFSYENIGVYTCTGSNLNGTAQSHVLLQVASPMTYFMIYSTIIGWAVGIVFFIGAMITSTIVRAIARKYQSRKKAIHNMLANIDSYKSTRYAQAHEKFNNLMQNLDAYKSQKHAQLQNMFNSFDVYRANRYAQLGHWKDLCRQQMDRLRENYHGQIARIRVNCARKMDKLRNNYNQKMSKMQDYRSAKATKLRTRYQAKMANVREYGSGQLTKLRDHYRWQQQYVIKVLETLNLQNCRDGDSGELPLQLDEGDEFIVDELFTDQHEVDISVMSTPAKHFFLGAGDQRSKQTTEQRTQTDDLVLPVLGTSPTPRRRKTLQKMSSEDSCDGPEQSTITLVSGKDFIREKRKHDGGDADLDVGK